MRFCGKCGTPLGATPAAAPRDLDDTAERRNLTVMFCDLADATRLSEQLDPEELREIVRDYQKIAKEVVQRFQGHVAQYLGDGLMVYFGYPQAQGDDARRAVQAGLGIVDAVAAYSARLVRERRLSLAVRVGIHTGGVVTGAVGTAQRREQLALGQTPNIAARLQHLAAPDEVVLSTATRKLTRGFFAFESLGAHAMKGLPDPMEIFRVVGESGVRSRFELAVRSGLTPLAGRREELAVLRCAFTRAAAGNGRAVLLTGDVGIGKSRLLYALREELEGVPHSWWSCHFSSDLRHSALVPVASVASQILGLDSEPQAAELSQLETALSSLGFPLEESVPFMAELLSMKDRGDYGVHGLNPGRLKEKALELLVDAFARLAQERPAIFVAEDVHWSDPSSLVFLELLLARTAEMGLLVLLTSPPSFSPVWTPPPCQSHLALGRLADASVEEMVGSLSGKPLPYAVCQQIVERAGGVPLFVEELTRMVLDSGQLRRTRHGWEVVEGRLTMEIPSTLQDVLMARLDGQQDAKETAQIAAVLGREFRLEQLAALCEVDEAQLRGQLDRLVEAGLISPPDERSAEYLFKSALIQETAYRSLLKSQRQHHHRKISKLLLSQPAAAKERPEVVAHHLTEGGQFREALELWLQAGQRALSRSDNFEAIGNLEKGLELLAGATISIHRNQLEIDFQNALGVAWTATRGFAAQEAEAAWERARELCEGLGEPLALAVALNGLWMSCFARTELEKAYELAQRTMQIAEAHRDANMLLMAHTSLGATLLYQGHFSRALQHLETGLAQESGDEGEAGVTPSVADLRVSALSLSALALWVRGYPEKAAAQSREAVDRARRLSHPFSLCYALSFGAWLHTFNRDETAFAELMDELRELAETQGYFLAEWGDFFLGPLLDDKEATATSSSGAHSGSLFTHTGFGLNLGMTSTCCFLAERYHSQGQIERAEGALHWGFDALGSGQERYWEGELFRLSGELVLALDAAGAEAARAREEAEQRFRSALEITARQGALSLELRAATSLARLLRGQGRVEKARGLLAEVYGRFTEGLDTADLQGARTLLETLG